MNIAAKAALLCAAGTVLGVAGNRFTPHPALFAAPGAPAAAAATAACQGPPPNAVARISVAEAAPLCAACAAAFVDSGTPAEFEAGHVTGAFHFGPGESAANLAPRLGSFATVIVYDRDPHCGLADRVAAELAAAGVQGVRVLEGAWPEWMARGAPGESGACSPCQAVKAVAR